MIRVIVYKNQNDYTVYYISKDEISEVREKLTNKGYHFVFVETNEDS